VHRDPRLQWAGQPVAHQPRLRPVRPRLHPLLAERRGRRVPVLPDPADGAGHPAGPGGPAAGLAGSRGEPGRAHLGLLALRGRPGAAALLPRLRAAAVRQCPVRLRHHGSPDQRDHSADVDPDRVVPERERHRRPGEHRQGARPGHGGHHRGRDGDLRRDAAEGGEMAALLGGSGGIDPPRRGGFRWVVLLVTAVYFLLPLWAALRFAGIGAFGSVVGEAGFTSSLALSVRLAVITTLLTIALILPTAVYVHLRLPKLRRLFEGITVLPIVIPPVVLIVGVLAIAPGVLKG